MLDLKENIESIRIEKTDNIKLLTIIIVSFNSRQYLKNCIDSIIKFPPKLGENEYEVIIVDNKSIDGSDKLIENQYLNYSFIKLIKNDSNKGFSWANNLVIKNGHSKYFLLLNSDTEVYENSINGLIEFFESLINRGKDIGIIGPKIINSDGSIQISCGRFPSFLNSDYCTILARFAGIELDNKFSRWYKRVDIDRNKPFEVDWVSGSAMMVSGIALKKAGMFDEKYFMYFEDVDLCYQMRKKGFNVYYYPLTTIFHYGGGSEGNNSILTQSSIQKSGMYFYFKTYWKSWQIIFIPLVFPVMVFRILITYLKNINKKNN